MKDNQAIDRHLVKRVLEGDTYAFETIITCTQGLVIHIVYKMIENQQDREDLIQEIYLKAYHRLSSFKFKSQLSTWIGAISYNTCINFLEKRKIPIVQMDGDEDNELGNLADPNLTRFVANETDSHMLSKERSQILQAEMEKLSPLYKTLITLFHKEELSYDEISKITGLPIGTLKSYLFRARRVLRDNLLNRYNKEDL
ncbi:MAG: sigma-70 family RNA polymerase sigma factor [Bacteroidota bacterium]